MAHRARSITTPIVLGVAAMALSACASSNALLTPRYPARVPSTEDKAPQQQAQNTPRHHGPTSSAPDPNHLTGTWKPYQVNGQWYYPKDDPDYDEVGMASWYGAAFDGKPTADGEIFDMRGLTAAHKTLPLPCLVEVTNLENGRTLQLRVNDRGPFVDGRLIDLSMGAADKLGVLRPGLAKVRVRYVGPAPDTLQPAGGPVLYASATPPPRTPKPPQRPAPSTASAGSLPKLDDEELQPLHAPDLELAATAPAPVPMPTSVPAPEPIVVADLPPLEPAPAVVASLPVPNPPELAPPSLPTPPSAPVAMASGRYAIQAAAFSNRANAEKAASQLASIGPVDITPIERNGGTLYRVTVRSLKDASAADDALERVSASGFRDAQIITPQ